jgi:hypothetical protein
MTRSPATRSLGWAALFVGLAILPVVYGDDPCYQSITEIPCPSAEGVFDDCQYQWDNGPGLYCEPYKYTARKSGKYGEGTTTPCLTLQVQTGTKCVPETDEKGVVVRVVCADQYKCKTKSPGPPAVCEIDPVAIKTFSADKYTLKTPGCLAPPGEG